MSMLMTAEYGCGVPSEPRYARLPLKKSSSPSKKARTIRCLSEARSCARMRAYSRSAAVPVPLSSAPGAALVAGFQPGLRIEIES
jgi:hypothetical protein